METKDNLTRNYIFEAFYELLLKHTFDEISVSDICTKAGVSRMSFYRNFKSKEDLASKATERIMQNFRANLQIYPQLNQYVITKEIFATAKKYKDAFKSFKNTDFIKNYMDSIAQRLFAYAPEDKINKNRKYNTVFYFSAITGVFTYWINHGAVETPDEMAKCICSIADFPIFDEIKLPNFDNPLI